MCAVSLRNFRRSDGISAKKSHTLARTGKPAKQIPALLFSLDLFGSFCIKAERTWDKNESLR
jgi:hypothetical protein